MFLANDAFGNNFALTSVPNTIKRGQEVADYHHDSPSLPQNVRKMGLEEPQGSPSGADLAIQEAKHASGFRGAGAILVSSGMPYGQFGPGDCQHDVHSGLEDSLLP